MPKRPVPALLWLEDGDDFPPVAQAFDANSGLSGLLAAGGVLDVETLVKAYAHGIFPWFNEGQPILWWSPDPRMVLPVTSFRLHASLRKTLRRFSTTPTCEVRFDSAFAQVMAHCAAPRAGSGGGTWILPQMQQAYRALYEAGHAHSVETWVNGELVGGLYCVALGRALFGESMFSLRTDASKIALAALVAWCRHAGVTHIDCQQNTRHLALLGAREMPRAEFLRLVEKGMRFESLRWVFGTECWMHLLPEKPADQ
ncbi:MAG: leucyl/phenylalanyl-tRNA--protein transferase [Burkholderiaceae bacterium]